VDAPGPTPGVTDLGGAWRACEADEVLRRAYPEPDFDDRGWVEVPVPGHWRSVRSLAGSDGPLLYRRAFSGGGGRAEGRRSWLVFEGVFYQTDVWLDGSYVGDTEGYFFPHSFEVTEALAERSEHVLAVEVACGTARRNVTGVFQGADYLDPDWNPGGIWRDVRIEETGPVRISRLRTLCGEATPERAVVSLRAVLDAAEAGVVRLVSRVGGVEHQLEQPVAAGENRVSWNVVVDGPELWWPWSLGAQPLTDVSVAVSFQDEPSDERRLVTGLRQVRMKNWVFTVNGERLFLKGSNVGPTRMDLACAEGPDFERDVLLARDAGLDLLRVHGHVSRPELYEAADRHGMLLWQDFPLHREYLRGIRKQAARQAREAVDLLGHHPSIVLWCGHNEPVPVADVRPSVPGFVVQAERPTWNKTVLDATVHRAFERSDSSRPAVPHSGIDDTHLYFGRHYGSVAELPGFLARWPRLGRFVSEFGAGGGGGASDAGGAGDASEEQALVVRRAAEWLRRLKYRPTGGFCQFLLADVFRGAGDGGLGVLGPDRMPKPGWDALREACAPVIVVADPLPAAVEGGETLALDVHVVSDLRVPLAGGVVRAVLTWEGGGHEWAWEGDVPADSCVLIGTLQFVVPDGVTKVTLDLALSAGDVTAANRY
jgi:beta-mannosidase